MATRANNNNNLKYLGVLVTLFLVLSGSTTDNQIRSHINKKNIEENKGNIDKYITKEEFVISMKILSIKLDAYNVVLTQKQPKEVVDALNRNLEEIRKLEDMLLYKKTNQ